MRILIILFVLSACSAKLNETFKSEYDQLLSDYRSSLMQSHIVDSSLSASMKDDGVFTEKHWLYHYREISPPAIDSVSLMKVYEPLFIHDKVIDSSYYLFEDGWALVGWQFRDKDTIPIIATNLDGIDITAGIPLPGVGGWKPTSVTCSGNNCCACQLSMWRSIMFCQCIKICNILSTTSGNCSMTVTYSQL